MATFSVLNGLGFNNAGIQLHTLMDQVSRSGLRFYPTTDGTSCLVHFADDGRLQITGTGMVIEQLTGGFTLREGTMTSMTYSMPIGVISPVITPIFSITGFSEPLTDLGEMLIGDDFAFTADLFSESDTITGSSVNDRLIGFAGADAMNGGAGIDTLSYQGSFAGGVQVSLVDGSVGIGGDAEGDTITGFENLLGSEGNDILDGNAGNNLLVGRGGADFLIGHLGDDTYVVDNGGDFALEVEGEGTDTVYAHVSYALAAFQSIETLIAVAAAGAIDLTGNEFAQAIVGNASDNVIDGGAGADTLSGNGGDDELRGGSGADLLKGSLGDDTLLGGDGNDVLNGRSYGPAGDPDVLRGGLGDDSYTVDSALDLVDEVTGGGGIDTVTALVHHTLAADVENLVLGNALLVDGTGNALANRIRGGNGINTLDGAAGNDRLAGWVGPDVLTGGAGRDLFDYDRAAHSAAAFAIDIITDFVRGEDRIDLATIDADPGIAGNQKFAFIGTAAFTAAGQVRVTQVSGNTVVEADVDGNLTADLTIHLDGLLALGTADFVL